MLVHGGQKPAYSHFTARIFLKILAELALRMPIRDIYGTAVTAGGYAVTAASALAARMAKLPKAPLPEHEYSRSPVYYSRKYHKRNP